MDRRKIITRKLETGLAGGSWTWGEYYYFSLYLFNVTEDEVLFRKSKWHSTVIQHWKDENRLVLSDQALHVAHQDFLPVCKAIHEHLSVQLLDKADMMAAPNWRSDIKLSLWQKKINGESIVTCFRKALEGVSKRKPYTSPRCVKLDIDLQSSYYRYFRFPNKTMDARLDFIVNARINIRQKVIKKSDEGLKDKDREQSHRVSIAVLTNPKLRKQAATKALPPGANS